MEHQADVRPQPRLIRPARVCAAKKTAAGRYQGRNAVGTPSGAPRGSADGKSLSAFSLKPQSDRLLAVLIEHLAPSQGIVLGAYIRTKRAIAKSGTNSAIARTAENFKYRPGHALVDSICFKI
jgi:hypothetical protein